MSHWTLNTPETSSRGDETGVVCIKGYKHDGTGRSLRIEFSVCASESDKNAIKSSVKEHVVRDVAAYQPAFGPENQAILAYTNWMKGNPDFDNDEDLLNKLAADGVIGPGAYNPA